MTLWYKVVVISPVSRSGVSTPNTADGPDKRRERRDRAARALDLALGLVALGVFAPFFVVAAALIHHEDGGPVFFRQMRLGQGRQPFAILKFRTMFDGREVTRAGRWLRRTGLDETAQFLNVLRGDMRVVGPRPLTAADVARLGWEDARFDGRWEAKPGITGLAQVFGGRSARHSRRLDELYARRRSLRLDGWLIGVSFGMNALGKHRVRALLCFVRQSRSRRRCAFATRPAAAAATR